MENDYKFLRTKDYEESVKEVILKKVNYENILVQVYHGLH